ncbi:Craniofacial development protein 1 [Coemansia furcata]|uniref:Craniofacial development protein 1 n=1 Tax=Coemansia furcata TaxID=417177 RepID=A0ACC1LK35_9FUNG|nr:Craniofacial development protein 1 [Coemansia furcata]
MSLLDLYKDERDLSEDEESEDEFVPDHVSEGDDGSDDDEDSDDDERPNEAEKEPVVAGPEVEQQKRRVDAIWSEMNDPVNPRSNKVARVDTESSSALENVPAKDDNNDTVDTAPTETSPEAGGVTIAEQPRPVARRGPVRRASKFSQLAEAVESRRAKKENTLEQARKEWTGFVAAEGIRDDLNQANKDGFVERQEFLRRTDERTYEKSRQEHLKRK